MTRRTLTLAVVALTGLLIALPATRADATVGVSVMAQDTTRRPPPKVEPKKPERPRPTGTPVLRRRPPPSQPPAPPPARPAPPPRRPPDG